MQNCAEAGRDQLFTIEHPQRILYQQTGFC
jgi:hypothetical protein